MSGRRYRSLRTSLLACVVAGAIVVSAGPAQASHYGTLIERYWDLFEGFVGYDGMSAFGSVVVSGPAASSTETDLEVCIAPGSCMGGASFGGDTAETEPSFCYAGMPDFQLAGTYGTFGSPETDRWTMNRTGDAGWCWGND